MCYVVLKREASQASGKFIQVVVRVIHIYPIQRVFASRHELKCAHLKKMKTTLLSYFVRKSVPCLCGLRTDDCTLRECTHRDFSATRWLSCTAFHCVDSAYLCKQYTTLLEPLSPSLLDLFVLIFDLWLIMSQFTTHMPKYLYHIYIESN